MRAASSIRARDVLLSFSCLGQACQAPIAVFPSLHLLLPATAVLVTRQRQQLQPGAPLPQRILAVIVCCVRVVCTACAWQ